MSRVDEVAAELGLLDGPERVEDGGLGDVGHRRIGSSCGTRGCGILAARGVDIVPRGLVDASRRTGAGARRRASLRRDRRRRRDGAAAMRRIADRTRCAAVASRGSHR